MRAIWRISTAAVRAARLQAGVSINTVQVCCRVSHTTAYRWSCTERTDTGIDDGNLYRLASLLGVSAASLVAL